MQRVLLVEPAYQNKYPPIGLMKIASFHRKRGDFVEFYKGEPPYLKLSEANRVYITSLFTFHYEIVVNCIKHCLKYLSKDKIYIGGIAATLMSSDFEKDTGVSNILRGLLTDSSVLGYKCKTNIDLMPLDYDILDDISYKYPAADNYFVHTTRGCPRKCKFCAVKDLEPEYKTTNNIIEQVKNVDLVYGKKRNLLVMDNNILHSDNLESIINDIYELGFNKERNYVSPNKFITLINKIKRRISYKANYSIQIEEALQYIFEFEKRIFRYKKIHDEYKNIIDEISKCDSPWDKLQAYETDLERIIEKYRSKAKVIRYVDFNQGIDARLFDEKKAKIISKIPINPFRLAYDSVYETDVFESSMKIAINSGIRHFSNYILYNWVDSPEHLWMRLNTAVKLYNNSDIKINAFSFPMRYSPVGEKDRKFIGKRWNKKYISAVNIILNVTKGVVAKELDFFYEAFGKDVESFFKILTMPDQFIRNRRFFKKNGLANFWEELYDDFDETEKIQLLDILNKSKTEKNISFETSSKKVNQILILYKINKSQFDRGGKTVETVMDEIAELAQL